MSDTPRTDAEPTYKAGIAQTRTVNIAFARQLERELAEAIAQRDLAVEALEIIKECFTTEAMFSETATAAITASMIKKVLKECVE